MSIELQIDEEFQAFIPRPSAEELDGLRKALIEAGRAIDPILVWRATAMHPPTIVDGHNRYRLCRELNLPYEVRELEFADREAVLAWMFEHQIARRNLSVDQVVMLAAMRGVPTDRGSILQRQQAAFMAAHDAIAARKVVAGGETIRGAYNVLTRKRPDLAAREVRPIAPVSPPAAVARAATQIARAELNALEAELAVHREREAALASLRHDSEPVVPRGFAKGRQREGCAVILASDWHVEETVEPDATPIRNEYSLEIAEKRIDRFFSGVRWLIDFHRPVFGIADAVMWLGGDLITGAIHDELRETSALTPTQVLPWLEARLNGGIEFLLRDRKLKRLTIPCSYGNHGRTTMKPRRATGAANSYEYLLYTHLADRWASHDRVRFEITPSAHQYVKVYDFDLHFHHGDEISYYGGVGGITIPVNKAVAQWQKVRPAHYHHFGHFHQYLDLGDTVVNGSLIGYNAYAMSIKATPEPPQQAFYVLDSKRGKTCKSPIWVST